MNDLRNPVEYIRYEVHRDTVNGLVRGGCLVNVFVAIVFASLGVFTGFLIWH